MVKFFVGLTVGAITAIVVMNLFFRGDSTYISTTNTESRSNSANDQLKTTAVRDPSNSNDSTLEPTNVVGLQAHTVVESEDKIVSENVVPEELYSANAKVNATPNPKVGKPPSVNEQKESSAEIDNQFNVDITEAHDKVIENSRSAEPPKTTLHGLHDKLNSEKVDETWSYYIEEQIKAYLSRTAVPAGIDIAGVYCRYTICEIQAFSFGVDGMQDWHNILGEMAKEPWYIDFTGTNIFSTSSETAESTVVFCYLHRKVEK